MGLCRQQAHHVHRVFGANTVGLNPSAGLVVAETAKLNKKYTDKPSSIAIISHRVKLVVFDEAHHATAPTCT